MSFPIETSIMPVLEGLVDALQPFAEANAVSLRLEHPDTEMIGYYNPVEVISDMGQVLSKIIAFTPQGEFVQLRCQIVGRAINLIIENSGTNLGSIGDIRNGLWGSIRCENTVDKGSRFIYRVSPPSPHDFSRTGNHDIIKPYYAEVRARLTEHFKNINILVERALHKDKFQGIFLQKVNAVITANLQTHGYNAESLARSMALSKAQLYRKVKAVTQMAPGQYITHFRLQKAEELLQETDLTISEIAYRCGFISLSHFSRAFNRVYQSSPSQFRKEQIQ